MHVEEIRDFALSLGEVTEGFPFGEEVLVLKTNNKMFLLVPLESVPVQFNAKCDPDQAQELRDRYPEQILPGYHMNKKHWNTVVITGGIKTKLVKELIAASYHLVQATVKKKPK